MIYFAFFASGVSGLIYQVVWVRAFGNVFGNTLHSASLVVAVFMLGLGLGSQAIGAWADGRYAREPRSLLRAYGQVELVIALIGFAVSMTVPHLGPLTAALSSYVQGADGWYVPSTISYITRLAITIVCLLPITFLMGGTLTLLIRHLVREDVSIAPNRIAMLYAVNTAGAAIGCFLTDFALVPAVGLLRTQMIAAALNVVAGVCALAIASPSATRRDRVHRRGKARVPAGAVASATQPDRTIALTSSALALTGFAALGMEILWFRQATILLGGFRAVFALLLTIVLAGIGIGAAVSGIVSRRTRNAAGWLIVVQTMFAVTAVGGVLLANARPIEATAGITAGMVPWLMELWFDLRPLLLLVAVPSILMGLGFPLANALVQQAEHVVARRAGGLYLANTAGAVAGSLVTGFVLLPSLGIQMSAAILAGASALAVVLLYLCSRSGPAKAGHYERELAPATAGSVGRVLFFGPTGPTQLVGSLIVIGAAISACVMLPPDFVIRRALGSVVNGGHLLAQREGLTEVISITESADGRLLLTNGHAMSSTARLSQRYMRALAHIPLLMMDVPASVLVIGFGVGNTSHAASLHPSVRRIDIADLSRGILEHASFFDAGNHRVLTDPRVSVFVNDGRQHLQMQPAGSYDLITLEPPPITYAGVAALYSREFYELARSRLTARGYVSQWLPTYQAPSATALSMVRAFIDVFPRAVLLSGAQADLLLVGTAGPSLELDPDRLAAALERRPAVRDDLARLDLGHAYEIAGAFVGSASRMRAATSDIRPVTDDWPLTEHSVLSALNPGDDVPSAVVKVDELSEWCPRCVINGAPAPSVAGLDLYIRLLELAYRATPADGVRLAEDARRALPNRRVIAGSAYLGAIVPDGAALYNTLGVDRASRGAMADAIELFRKALQLEPESAQSHWHLGAALAMTGARQEAIAHLQRSVDLDPTNTFARNDLNALRSQQH